MMPRFRMPPGPPPGAPPNRLMHPHHNKFGPQHPQQQPPPQQQQQPVRIHLDMPKENCLTNYSHIVCLIDFLIPSFV